MAGLKLRLRQWIPRPRAGQSIVEFAIAIPILVLMFVGVFEVGWALRGYLVLANVNRESARFAVKNTVLDFSTKNPAQIGYPTVVSHTMASLSEQLPLEFLGPNPNATMIMSHLVIDTGYPCVKYNGANPKVPYEFDAANCDCNESNPNAPQWFTRDDLVLHPDLPGFSHYLYTVGISRTTRIGGGSFAAEAQKLALENNQFNCSILKTGNVGEISVNNLFIVETFYDQPQLLGVPIISNRITDPIPFYTHTVMRIVSSRDSVTTDLIGPACILHPIIFNESDLPAQGAQFNAFQGGGTGQFGWLTWNPDPSKNDPNYVLEELVNPRLSLHDFTDALDSNDHTISLGDNVSSGPGVMISDDIDKELKALEGQIIRVPVYQVKGGSGQNTYYTITHFALIRVDQACLPSQGCTEVSGNDKRITATFLGFEDDACVD